jgi:adenylosuccinate synthase
LTGTGAATARKVLRDPHVQLAADIRELGSYLTDVSDALNRALDRGEDVIVEGTQGFGLSLHHSKSYPYVTSRDTTAAAFLSDAGLSPLLVTDIIMVIRTYPIRVAGSSGPLSNEISWEEIGHRARYAGVPAEFTTVTGNLRRVSEFDWELVERAVKVIRPTMLALHGADYLDYDDYGKTRLEDLGPQTVEFVAAVEARFGVPVSFIFTGPEQGQIVDRRLTPVPSAAESSLLQSLADV